MKLKLLITLVFVSSISFAQNLDSLFEDFARIKGIKAKQHSDRIHTADNHSKCGIGTIIAIQENFEKFDKKRQNQIKEAMARPSLQTSIVTPNGYFRVHYDSVGTNKPSYNLNDFIIALDSVYEKEVINFGYIAAPSDNGKGGDDLFDVYIENLPAGLYGVTTPEDLIKDNRYTSYTEIDNSFLKSEGYYTYGINAAKVTAAHEYHHAIQIGSYINRYSQDGFYYEITSTAMEEFTFDYVNDYYGYMSSYFNQPDISISLNNGYNLAILNLFFEKRFNQTLLKRIWELVVNNRALSAISKAVAEQGSTIGHEFNTFGQWTYFTGRRADITTNMFFDYDEAVNYPLIKPATTINFLPPSKSLTINSQPLSNNFIVFPDQSQGTLDTLVAIITNADVTNAINSPNSSIQFSYTVSNDNLPGSKSVNNRYYTLLESDIPGMFSESGIFNNVPVDAQFSSELIDFVYPQPFVYSKHDYLFIPTVPNSSGVAEVKIFSTSMDLIYSGQKKIFSIDKVVTNWDALDNNANKVPSGIYIYVTKSGNNITKGKFVIIND